MIEIRRPIVLVGETKSARNVEILKSLKWGRMFVAKHPTPYPCEPWGFDNGAFPAWLRNEPFPTEKFERRLDAASAVSRDPYLAVAPDIVANGCESLNFSLKWRTGKLRDIEWPWYLAVQDGMQVSDVEPHLHLFAGIFLGGTDRFKSQAWRWCQLAHKYQKRFHYGRASTPGKLQSAFKVGADSCDSSFPLWTNERMRIFTARWEGLGYQRTIDYEEANA